MNYAQVRKMDIANGEGIRVSLFTSGCTHHCKSCFNEEYQSFTFGEEMTEEVGNQLLEEVKKDYCRGLTILGGEPFQAEGLYKFIGPIRKYIDEYNKNGGSKKMKRKDIWIYSGYTFDQLIKDDEKRILLEMADVLIDGKFVEDLLDLTIKFRGSSNQRILDVKKSLEEGHPILYYENQTI